jgi:hypothetical protein
MANGAASTTEDYIAAIREKINFLRADMRSYVYLRLQRGWNTGGHGLGGGNVTLTLASFTLLGLLSKTYLAVENPGAFVLRRHREVERKRCEACKRRPRRRRLHDVNESDAFFEFVRWLRDHADVDLGVGDDESRQVWKEFRNWLAHRFDTRHIAVAYVFQDTPDMNHTTEEFDTPLRTHIETNRVRPLQRMNDGVWTFNVDVFYILLDDVDRAMKSALTAGELTPDTREILDVLVLRKPE